MVKLLKFCVGYGFVFCWNLKSELLFVSYVVEVVGVGVGIDILRWFVIFVLFCFRYIGRFRLYEKWFICIKSLF